ncbi:hypothetical protein CCACVL1_04330 [Corchorus capsularis]|uniref:Uncharacterized protein n=1 Tax=Corchorus capsularis TaxID=210143 RepID=A0A1R3JTU6_COCAP|nr:hypothetical protein CCACVL1_04330 [Corchorus capsularis]
MGKSAPAIPTENSRSSPLLETSTISTHMNQSLTLTPSKRASFAFDMNP